MFSLPHNTFKEALAAGRRQFGLWVNFPHHGIAEVLAGSGFDWLLFDMEHTPSEPIRTEAWQTVARALYSTPEPRMVESTWLHQM